MNYNLGGSGVFVNIVIFNEVNGELKFNGSFAIGDRVPVNKISGPTQTTDGNYQIKVDYLDRTANQPMSETPKVSQTATIPVVNNQIKTLPFGQ
jgi:hypothetical protein